MIYVYESRSLTGRRISFKRPALSLIDGLVFEKVLLTKEEYDQLKLHADLFKHIRDTTKAIRTDEGSERQEVTPDEFEQYAIASMNKEQS